MTNPAAPAPPRSAPFSSSCGAICDWPSVRAATRRCSPASSSSPSSSSPSASGRKRRCSRASARHRLGGGAAAALLSLDRLFLADYEDGSLEDLALAPLPLELLVLAKVRRIGLSPACRWRCSRRLLGLLLGLHPSGLWRVGRRHGARHAEPQPDRAVGAALTLGARRGGVLLSLLVLPLYIPILILGRAPSRAPSPGWGARPHLLLLAPSPWPPCRSPRWAAAAACAKR